ncbi:MAG TPA: hypothetical protein VL981_10355 [Candidatus Methylacidiphilales bacterium]|nr:hypothetical protein [Candidatus Methylacidiphilales bacterium]
MFRETCAEAPWHIGKITINITTEMNLAHKQYLVMGFRRFFVAWNVADGVDARGIPRAQVFTLQQANDWFYRVLGSAPSTNQIYVVTLSDVQNATGNQLIQGRPLSDFQNEAKQNQQK